MPTEDYIAQPDPSTKIWRYMDEDKFVSLIRDQALYFCQVKRLQDQYEGSSEMNGLIPPDLKGAGGSELEDMLEAMYSAPNGPRAYIGITCWHINDHESMSMWSIYGKIAIQSSVGKLVASLPTNRKFIGGAVTYEPLHDIKPGDGCGYEAFIFRKRPEYKGEVEYRVITLGNHQKMNHEGGLLIPVDLKLMIEKIYIAPHQPAYAKMLVEHLVSEAGLDVEVIQSDLGSRPRY